MRDLIIGILLVIVCILGYAQWQQKKISENNFAIAKKNYELILDLQRQIDQIMVWYWDADGDGYGDPDGILVSAKKPRGYVGNSIDCDDHNDGVNPVADEVSDGIDNNCNTYVDDDDPYLVVR